MAPHEDVALPTALRELTETFSRATGLPVSLVLTERLPDLSPLQRNALFRAAQEGLTNVERHAQATEAWVMISAKNETIALTIADNGQGLPDANPRRVLWSTGIARAGGAGRRHV